MQVWALVNLVLSIAGVVLSIIVTFYVLLQRKQKSEQQLSQKKQSNKYANVNVQHTGNRNGDQAVEEKQRQKRHIWLATAIIAGIAGIIVFLLTEDMSHTMVMIDKWTIVNVVIFIVEIIAITFTVKHKKDNINNGSKEQEWSNTT
jgi:predicted nucleic acid-binding protein